MKRLYIISIIFLLSYLKTFPQIYTLQNNEKLRDAYVLSENNYAIVIEKNTVNMDKTLDIIYKNARLTGYKDSGIIKILPNGNLVATMLKPSLGKDMWVIIYGNIEQEFDSIEQYMFSKNNSVIFARLMDYGIAVVNGNASVQYTELFDYTINDHLYAFSYSRDGEYFININGEEKAITGKADRLKFSNDGNNIIYVINGEENANIFNGDDDTESFKNVDDLASYQKNIIAYGVKMLPESETMNTNESESIDGTNMNEVITNTVTVTNYNLSNISVLTNEEGVTVKGQSNTIALMTITNIITNIKHSELSSLPPAADTNEIIVTNEFINTTIIANGRNYGEFASVSNISFSPDGKTLVFININTNDTMQLYIGGNMTTNYDIIHNYKYSDDSKMLAYSAQTNGVSFIVLNNRRLPYNYDSVSDLYFSVNNNLIYDAVRSDRHYIIGNNFESPSYSKINSFKFLGDSFAFTAERLGKHYYFILDKETSLRRELGGYDYVSDMDNNQDSAISIASDGKKIFIIKNGQLLLTNQ